MRNRLIMLFIGLLFSIHCINGQNRWRTFMFYDITDSISPDSLTIPVIKVFTRPIRVHEYNVSNIRLEYKINIDDTKFSEYIMGALTHARSGQAVQKAVEMIDIDSNHSVQFDLYRFHPYIDVENGDENIEIIRPYKSNLHSFGLGFNKQTGYIILNVWLTNNWVQIQSDSINAINIIDTANFCLKPDNSHLEKVKFDYMVASIINYWDENAEKIVNTINDVVKIDVVRNNSGKAIGLRFHTPALNLGENP